VVEDEATLRESLKDELEDAGFSVDLAEDGEAGLFLGREYPFDVAVIDLGLPRLSGMDLIAQLRTLERDFPILILTARGNWQDKVEGLESGADDYLVKPYQAEELLARVRALIRRSTGHSQSVLEFGALRIDTSTQQVRVADEVIELTAYEYRVLEYMALHAGEVISKTTLTEHIYDQDFDRDSNVIEVFVGRLRRKLKAGQTEVPIETLRGRGYRFGSSVE
jgi:two-component system response regulator PhoP